jgi:hypothetical protein
VNNQVLRLKQIGYSMKEIRELNVLRALKQIESDRYEKMLWQCEVLQVLGWDVFKKNTRYKEFFDGFEEKQSRKEREKIAPVKIAQRNDFMVG